MPRTRGRGHLYRQPHSAIWWMQWHSGGRRYRESSGMRDFNEAEGVLRRRIAETVVLGPQVPASMTVADLVLEKLRHEDEASFKDTRSNRRRWELHLKPALGHVRVRDLRTSRLREYRRQRTAEGAPPTTVNRELSVVRAAYRLAWNDDRIRLSDIPSFPMESERASVRKGFLRDSQYRKVFDACMKEGLWLAAAFQVAWSYGWRRNEIFPMRVSQLDFSGPGCIHLPDSKNESGRIMVMTAKVTRLLKKCVKGKGPDGFVFTRNSGRPVRSHYKAWRRAVTAAGVPALRLHDLRRTATRNLVRAGIPKHLAQEVTGHKDAAVFDRYDITSLPDLAWAAKALDGRTAIHSAIRKN